MSAYDEAQIRRFVCAAERQHYRDKRCSERIIGPAQKGWVPSIPVPMAEAIRLFGRAARYDRISMALAISKRGYPHAMARVFSRTATDLRIRSIRIMRHAVDENRLFSWTPGDPSEPMRRAEALARQCEAGAEWTPEAHVWPADVPGGDEFC